MSALDALLPEDGASCLQAADDFLRQEVADKVLGWDASDAQVAVQTQGQLDDLGLTGILELEDLGSDDERRALLLATARVLGETDAGIAMGMMLVSLTASLIGEPAGFGVRVSGPSQSSIVGIDCGQSKMLVVGGGGCRLVATPSSRSGLLGLKLGGGRVFEDLVTEGEGEIRPGLLPALRLGALAVAIGSATGSLRTASAYAEDRYQGGQQIARHHAVQALLGSMQRRIAKAEIMLVHLLGCAEPDAELCDEAISDCDLAVVDGVQVLGGYGYMQEYGQEKRMRDVKTLRLLFGAT